MKLTNRGIHRLLKKMDFAVDMACEEWANTHEMLEAGNENILPPVTRKNFVRNKLWKEFDHEAYLVYTQLAMGSDESSCEIKKPSPVFFNFAMYRPIGETIVYSLKKSGGIWFGTNENAKEFIQWLLKKTPLCILEEFDILDLELTAASVHGIVDKPKREILTVSGADMGYDDDNRCIAIHDNGMYDRKTARKTYEVHKMKRTKYYFEFTSMVKVPDSLTCY